MEVEVALSGAGSATRGLASVGSPDVGLLERQVCDVLTEVPRAIDTLDHARRERGTVELG